MRGDILPKTKDNLRDQYDLLYVSLIHIFRRGNGPVSNRFEMKDNHIRVLL